ncbi:MAG: multicopper oxidase family protein [Propylenella sp.]
MNHLIDRRSFLAGSARLMAVGGAGALLPASLRAAAPATTLTIDRRTIDVKGKAASVFDIRRTDGTPGIELDPGARFLVDLVNSSGEDTIIHWHGQKAPYLQDGVTDERRPLLGAGTTQSYDFAPTPGTHWMHSHHGLQEQALMAAPLVVRSSDDVAADMQEVTILLHDFSFRDPEEILAGLTGGAAMAGDAMGGGMDHSKMGHSGMTGMNTGAMDLNDVEYDAFLANDRTFADPLVVQVEPRGSVRLRLINGAASTAFWIDLGALSGALVAVDGTPVEPVSGSRFPMTMAQRLDLIVETPASGAYPITAQVEGRRDRTGLILATPAARIEKVSDLAPAEASPVDLSLETRLRAAHPLAEREADRRMTVQLTGSMSPYLWSIDDRVWPDANRPTIRGGERVAIELQNRTEMAHPMHLHGHHFQVIAVNGSEIRGAVRDTVLVPVMGSVKIAFDADNPGRWPFHCHNLYHMATGMMTELVYDSFV